MQLYSSQIQQMAKLHGRQQAADLKMRVDKSLAPDLANQPVARLHSLVNTVVEYIESFGVLSPLIAVDVRETAKWLQLNMEAGAVYGEARAAALLYGAAALGALWFVDDRLLPADQLLATDNGTSSLSTLKRAIYFLMKEKQGTRYQLAARKEHELRPGLTFTLQRALNGGMTPEFAQSLIAAAFDDADVDDQPEEIKPRRVAIDRFMATERLLLGHANITDMDSQTLCIAGDLALGLGRCVRLLAYRQSEHPDTPPLDWLRSAINGLAGLDK